MLRRPKGADSPILKGGTSGIGAAVARSLASRGAQIVLLTQHPLTDPFLADYIMDMRMATNNELITAEQVDLASLNSIRKFATKWVDNAPPRRLDMVILCASTFAFAPKREELSEATEDGFELAWGVNYVANFHLLSILSPAIRAQPGDRDVRILFGTCSSYMGGRLRELLAHTQDAEKWKTEPMSNNHKEKNATSIPESALSAASTEPQNNAAYATSKLALMTFASAFQKHLSSYKRPDKQPSNARIILVDPGFTRTPSSRRYLSFGSLLGLAVYLVLWPLWWLILKSPEDGAQTFLHAAMDEKYGKGDGGCFLKECKERQMLRNEIGDIAIEKALWEMTEKAVQVMEKEGATRRAKEKKVSEAQGQKSNAASTGNNKNVGNKDKVSDSGSGKDNSADKK